MNNEAKHEHWEKVFSVIEQSYSIDEHFDFFNWMQESVNKVLPHSVLLTSWGNFTKNHQKNKLRYDVASALIGVSKQFILDNSDEVDSVIVQLHQAWLNNNRCWFALNNLDVIVAAKQSDTDLIYQVQKNLSFIQREKLKSMLVYGVSDRRGSNECLYVFFSKLEVFEVRDSVLSLIMPYIDNVLRKIQHL